MQPDEEFAIEETGSYICDSCGEEIVIPLDPSAGPEQEYAEDCPVCCHPNVILVAFDSYGRVEISSHAE